MEDKINAIIISKLKQKTGLPEIKIALQYAGFNIDIRELVLRVNELE